MTREEAKRLLPIIKAFSDGKTLQYRVSPSIPRPDNRDVSYLKEWVDLDEDKFDGFCFNGTINYRIKPETKYRPFKSQEECVKEMMNHKPFGIVTDGIRDFNVAIYPDGIFILGTSNKFYTQSFYTALKEYKFPDSAPFGVKEE